MSASQTPSTHDRWAQLRFAVVGPLLAAPPPRGELRARIEELAQKTWPHPTNGDLVRCGASTIERRRTPASTPWASCAVSLAVTSASNAG